MNKWKIALLIALLPMLLLPACVTINIYFPAAAAEKAADKIIDDVWQLKQPKDKAPDAPDATTPAK
ncbi:MAG: hypothetical protein ACAH07_10660 [Methylophilaceae bacterium]|jgi:hypothetical protein|nr:hypothetical protein [Methyloradius sp.]